MAFCAAAFLARSGGAMMGVGIVLMVSALYGSYGWAGGLTAANGLAWGLGSAVLSRLVDRYGQSRVMVPGTVVSALGLVWLIVAAWVHSPVWALFIPAVISGATAGSASALVRARWNYVLRDAGQLHTAFSLESTLDEVTYIIGPVVATALATTVHPTAGLIAPVVLGLAGGLWFYYGLRGSQPPVRGLPAGLAEGGAGSSRLTSGVGDGQTSSPTAVAGRRRARPKTGGARALPAQRDRFVLAFGGVAPVIAVTVFVGCSFGAIDVSTVAATTYWGARPMAGVVLAAISLGSALAGLAYGARLWQAPLPRRFLIGVAAYAGLVTLYLLAHNVAMLTICGFLAGSAVAPSLTNANSLVNELVPKHRLTEGLAWVGTSLGIGASLGSSLAGRLIDASGYVAGYLTALSAAVTALLVALAGAKAVRRQVLSLGRTVTA